MARLTTEIRNPSKHDRGIAKQSFQQIRQLSISAKKTAFLEFEGVHVELPSSAVKLVVTILNEIAEGNSLTLIPQHAHLTTQEAADMLNVSRPYFVKLLQEGKIPFEKIGNRRRVLARDVMAFKDKARAESEHALQELVDLAQKLDMGY
ncbi:TPA: helix-turn-helix domain-containing protein [Legionella pneumophila]|uniref:helix-turn-helix domain-containing protein n=1 Tax=Legionella pneumophila TaxID=446 RepID=UPI000D0559D2|nr:helix-turn-helix domain-containing protein [Legionella pneumophila]HAT2013208.1 helix-turn-helix domain-containing protein [Legionella pneumophila]HAU0153750.1 helix-turn-helix domain-containing protein [Legionella pneumophila]HAU1067515.1 helix-turn-helix domain-containing protein [Legionella pneumophila]HAU1297605.1 helix-turn-helix domain-containing protein [Legionella pneumophila]